MTENAILWDCLSTEDRFLLLDFRNKLPNVSGLIVVSYDEKTFDCEYYYDGCSMCPFSEEHAEMPNTYKTIRGLEGAIKKIKSPLEYGGCSFEGSLGIAFWVHPDAHLQPLDKHLKTRSQFPGSPRQ